jgi:hypothetical protein
MTSAHPISAVVILSGPSLADLMQENISTIHRFCTRSALFVCCVAHPRSDLSTLVYTSGVHELSLLPHGDVVRLCVADGYHLFATAGDPSCDKTSTNALWFRVILISAWCLLYPVRPFCSTFRELHSFLPHRNPSYHPVSLCPCRTLAPTDRATIRCLTAVCYCLDYLPPLRHSYP